MVHYGKHIIDPKTGLCEICDRGAIHDQRTGKRTTKQFLYSNQDGKFTYRPNDNYQDYDEPVTNHRTVRKPANHSVPGRSRLDNYDEDYYPTKRAPTRREQTPPDESPRRQGRSKVYYEVDDDGQIYPRDQAPPDEPRRRYLTDQSKTGHYNDDRHRRALTPPPPRRNDNWNGRSQHTNNSDSELVERRPKPRSNHYSSHDDTRAEMYHIDAYPRISTRTLIKPDDSSRNPPKRRQHQLEPIERRPHREPEPSVERRVHRELEPSIERRTYRKLPTTRSDAPPPKLYTADGEELRLTRKVETIYPSSKSDHSPRAKKYTTFYQIDSDRHY